MAILVIIRALLPILAALFLQNVLYQYIDKFNHPLTLVFVVFMGCLLALFYWITRYNNFYKYHLINQIQEQILSLYFQNKIQDTTAKKNANNISSYFWNILIAVQGLVESFYLKINFFLTIVLIVILGNYSLILAAIAIFWSVVFFIAVKPLVDTLTKNYKGYINDSNAFAGDFEVSIRTTLDINAFSKKPEATLSFHDRMNHFFDSVISLGDLEARIRVLLDILITLMLITYFIVYYILYSSGSLTLLAGISSGIYVLYIAAGGISSVFDSYLAYKKSRDAIEYIESKNDFKVAPETAQVKLGIDRLSTLEVTDLSYQYDDKLVISNQSFTFEAGKIYTISGSNGSGKSTLAKLLCGLMKMQRGTLRFNQGISCYHSLHETNIRDYLSFYSTEMDLFQQTVKNNVFFNVFTGDHSADIKDSELYRVGKEHLLFELEDVYVITNGGTNVSQGQKQKLLLLRTLCKEADVFLFDEPTGNLDQESEAGFIRLIKKYAHELNKMVIVISHSDNVIKNSDVVYHLDAMQSDAAQLERYCQQL